MRVIFTFLLVITTYFNVLIASATSTYFNIYLPTNNDAVQRNVALIVTALYRCSHFEITTYLSESMPFKRLDTILSQISLTFVVCISTS
jgi:hypothetical protein